MKKLYVIFYFIALGGFIVIQVSDGDFEKKVLSLIIAGFWAIIFRIQIFRDEMMADRDSRDDSNKR